MERAFRSDCGYLFLTGVEALLEQTTMGALSGDRPGKEWQRSQICVHPQRSGRSGRSGRSEMLGDLGQSVKEENLRGTGISGTGTLLHM